MEQMQKNITVIIRESTTGSTESIDRKLSDLQKELLKKANNKEAYDEIAEQIFALREQKEQSTIDTYSRDEQLSVLSTYRISSSNNLMI